VLKKDRKNFCFAERQGLVVARAVERWARQFDKDYSTWCERAKWEPAVELGSSIVPGDTAESGRPVSAEVSLRILGGRQLVVLLENFEAKAHQPSNWEDWWVEAVVIQNKGGDERWVTREELQAIREHDRYGWYHPHVFVRHDDRDRYNVVRDSFPNGEISVLCDCCYQRRLDKGLVNVIVDSSLSFANARTLANDYEEAAVHGTRGNDCLHARFLYRMAG
jgi:hypothetical protein